MKKFTIQVDPGYLFDFLSIYDVKFCKFSLTVNEDNFMNTAKHIIAQIGYELYSQILKSQEYAQLYDINFKLFELVDLAKTDKVKASEVDAGVWKRYLAKKALQEKFFPDSAVQEQKFGYGQK
jgi:hypothetical protein